MYPAYFLSFVVHGAPLRVINVEITAGPGPGKPPGEAMRIDAALFLANQDARSATHELQLTPLAENWTP